MTSNIALHLLLAALSLSFGAVPVLAEDHPGAPVSSAARDQTGMALTVYNALLPRTHEVLKQRKTVVISAAKCYKVRLTADR